MDHLVKIQLKSSFTLFECVGPSGTILIGIQGKEIQKEHEDTFAPPHIITNIPIESLLLHKYIQKFLLFTRIR